MPEVERTVDACKAAGALGARIMGGGFGGSVLALFRPGGGSSERRGAGESGSWRSAPVDPVSSVLKPPAVDRRLADKNLRTGLIAGAIALIVFALSWVVGLVY